MQRGHVVRRLRGELLREVFAEQLVARVHRVLRVERRHQLLALQPREQGRRVVAGRDRVAQRRRQPVDDRRLAQEPEQLRRQLRAQLVEEAADRARRTRQGAQQFLRVASPLERERGDAQGRRPAIGHAVDRADFGRAQPLRRRQVEKLACLVAREAQSRSVHFEQLAARAQRTEFERRLGARQQHQPQVRRRVAQQEGDRLVDALVAHDVVVVEEQEEFVAAVRDLVHQHRLQVRQGGRIGDGQALLADLGAGPVQRVDDVEEEPARLVVVRVEREPGHRVAALEDALDPREGERGLAEAARRAQHRQRPLAGLGQQGLEPGAGDAAGPRRRGRDLRGDHRNGASGRRRCGAAGRLFAVQRNHAAHDALPPIGGYRAPGLDPTVPCRGSTHRAGSPPAALARGGRSI